MGILVSRCCSLLPSVVSGWWCWVPVTGEWETRGSRLLTVSGNGPFAQGRKAGVAGIARTARRSAKVFLWGATRSLSCIFFGTRTRR